MRYPNYGGKFVTYEAADEYRKKHHPNMKVIKTYDGKFCLVFDVKCSR